MRFLRFADLKERGIVSNWMTLHRWVESRGFPPGRLLGENTRVWTQEELDHWLASRPTGRVRRKARAHGGE
jgi:predicted DNA-binding transcriptional regulator AlpA